MTVEVPSALAGERIDRVVALLTGSTRAEASDLIAGANVKIDGVVATKGSVRVSEGSVIDVTIDAPAAREVLAADPSVDVVVVHEDADLIVVDKPAGLIVHPGAGNRTGTLVQGLLARYPEIALIGDPARPGIVHRIDKDTSGLLAVARSELGYVQLSAQIAAHAVTRRYLALVWGHPDAPRGMIDAPIGRSAHADAHGGVGSRPRGEDDVRGRGHVRRSGGGLAPRARSTPAARTRSACISRRSVTR